MTKTGTEGNRVNWTEVERATEIRRTYLVRDKEGKEFFKMYKPSEVKEIFKKNGWRGQIVSTIDRNPKKENFRDICKTRSMNKMFGDRNWKS